MGYFSDLRRNWAGAFWAATAIPLVLDPWNPIWDESVWLEEQFGAPFAPLGPSGGNDYFTPNFWAGRSSETVGRRGPITSPIVSLIIRGTCGAQSSNLIIQKNLPWTPPPLNTFLPWIDFKGGGAFFKAFINSELGLLEVAPWYVWLELLAEFLDIGAEPAQSHTPPKYGARNSHISQMVLEGKDGY